MRKVSSRIFDIINVVVIILTLLESYVGIGFNVHFTLGWFLGQMIAVYAIKFITGDEMVWIKPKTQEVVDKEVNENS